MADRVTPEELKRRREESRRKALAAFQYPRQQVSGEQALTTWESLRASGLGAPVVIGDDEALSRLVELSSGWPGIHRKTPEEIIEVAARLRHPDDLVSHRSKELAKAHDSFAQLLQRKPDAYLPPIVLNSADGTSRELTREETIAEMMREAQPKSGEWPATAPGSPELSVAAQPFSGAPVTAAHVIVIPTDDWTTIPAFLHWGGWNSCPAPEYHVAALRSWRDRFGAELVGLGPDVMNIRVQRRPDTRRTALDLAGEQYTYCNDIIDQGVGTLSALAAALMENNWWFFWWD